MTQLVTERHHIFLTASFASSYKANCEICKIQARRNAAFKTSCGAGGFKPQILGQDLKQFSVACFPNSLAKLWCTFLQHDLILVWQKKTILFLTPGQLPAICFLYDLYDYLRELCITAKQTLCYKNFCIISQGC